MSIKLHFILMIGCITSVILLGIGGLNLWIKSVENNGAVINIAGRQRMLTQKMTKEAVTTLAGYNQNESSTKTQQLFEKSLDGLLNGNPEMGLQATQSPDIRTQLLKVQALWVEFKQSLNSLDNTTSEAELKNSLRIQSRFLRR